MKEQQWSGWGKKVVSPKDLFEELDTVWHESASLAKDTVNKDLTSARMFLATLLLIVDLNQIAKKRNLVSHLISELCVNYPSRFIIVGLDTGSNDAISVEVSSQCVFSQSGTHVCSEEIYLSIGEDSIDAVPSIVRTVLVPDVPAEILVLGDRRGDSVEGAFPRLLSKLSPLVDRVIFDSGNLGQVGKVTDISSYIPSNLESSAPMSDLAWRRLANWRRVVTEQFDLCECLDPFKSIHSVSICGIGRSLELGGVVPSPDMVMLGAWFVNKLNWHVDSLEKSKTDYRTQVVHAKNESSLHPSVLRFVTSENNESLLSPKTDVVSLSIEALLSNGNPLIIKMERSFEEEFVQVTIDSSGDKGPHSCDWKSTKVLLPKPELSDLVLAELSSGINCSERTSVLESYKEIVNLYQ